MKKLSTFLVAAATSALVAVVLAPPAQAADLSVRPAQLQRGPDSRLPHIEGNQVVEGSRRVDVPGTDPLFQAEAGDDYVVASLLPGSDGNDELHLWLVGDQAPVDLGVEYPYGGDVTVAVSPDRKRILVVYPYRTDNFWVRDLATGRTIRHGEVGSSSTLLGFDGRRAYFGTYRGLVRWNANTGRYTRLDPRDARVADLAGDRVALQDRDGCTVVTSLRAPGRTTWRSCTEVVQAFSPGGRRMVTQGIHHRRYGPRLWLRTVSGRELRGYRGAKGYADVTFETRWAFVLDVAGARTHALVRCTAKKCERAGAFEQN